MRTNKCPVCGEAKSKTKFFVHASHGKNLSSRKSKYQYVRCSMCTAVYLVNQNIDNDFYKKHYPAGYYAPLLGVRAILEQAFAVCRNWQRKKLISSHVVCPATILDVGAGDCQFVKSLNPKKFDISAYDYNAPQSPLPKHIKFTVGDYVRDKSFSQRFDCVVSWHVIEHISEPQGFVKQIYMNTNDKGVVIVSTPNTDSMGFRLSKGSWYHMDAPRHIILYNDQSIEHLFASCGFRLKQKFTEKFEFPLDLFWSLRASNKMEPRLLAYPLLKLISNETRTYVFEKAI
ncbi:class I SAM-dependent methyltransferase [Candidatus Microgenomates bacterium]|nr:MAG: class I SAM-dependent methyltransferase [Candidatus Microgenomates bacterium]